MRGRDGAGARLRFIEDEVDHIAACQAKALPGAPIAMASKARRNHPPRNSRGRHHGLDRIDAVKS